MSNAPETREEYFSLAEQTVCPAAELATALEAK